MKWRILEIIKTVFDTMLRLSWKEALVVSTLPLVVIFIWYSSFSISQFWVQNEQAKNELDSKTFENKKFAFVEDALARFSADNSLFALIANPDLQHLKNDVKSLMPNGVVLTHLIIKTESWKVHGTINGVAPDGRTVDFVVSILNEYAHEFKKISTVTLNSVSNSAGMTSFTLETYSDPKTLIDWIYTDDIDWDGVSDYKIVKARNELGVESNKKVLNDICPFTRISDIVIGRLIHDNPELLSIFPYYKEAYDRWEFDFDPSSGCMKSGDQRIE